MQLIAAQYGFVEEAESRKGVIGQKKASLMCFGMLKY